MLTAVLVLSVFSALLALLSLARTGRIIQDQNNIAEAFVIASNVQNKKLTNLSEDVHSALDCLVFVDAKCSDQNDDGR